MHLLLKDAAKTGTLWMTDLCNAVVKDGKVPEKLDVNVHKGRGLGMVH